MEDRKKVRIMLKNNICYHGHIISEDDFFVIIIDKFKNEVRVSKNEIMTMEITS